VACTNIDFLAAPPHPMNSIPSFNFRLAPPKHQGLVVGSNNHGTTHHAFPVISFLKSSVGPRGSYTRISLSQSVKETSNRSIDMTTTAVASSDAVRKRGLMPPPSSVPPSSPSSASQERRRPPNEAVQEQDDRDADGSGRILHFLYTRYIQRNLYFLLGYC